MDEEPRPSTAPTPIDELLGEHFGWTPIEELVVTARKFPYRMRADVEQAVRAEIDARGGVMHLSGVLSRLGHRGLDIAALMVRSRHDPAVVAPIQYEELEIGDATPLRCMTHALWLLETDGVRYVVLLAVASTMGHVSGLSVQVAVPQGEDGTDLTRALLSSIEQRAESSPCYRGKILSLECANPFRGTAGGLSVHQFATVAREEVILPRATIDLLERNVFGFCRQRERLRALGLPTKKGLLFYGPPGTGKTHSIRYLAGALADHTTLIMTAAQVVMIDQYMSLARLLQPSLVVIEDADLIARDRQTMQTPGEEVLLNKLLNEMDGLRGDCDVLFVLTTNRPETLEAALASRPGRIDQAIEFPLPDDEGRAKLLHLYAAGMELSDEVVENAVRRTEGVSASFIRELMRRTAQTLLERGDEVAPTVADLDFALDEILFTGGSLNRLLLGASDADAASGDAPG